MPTLQDRAYERHRRVSGGQNDDAHFRPRLGATIELFGTPVVLGPQHALGCLAAAVFAGFEGVLAVIVLFIGWIFLKSQPEADAGMAEGDISTQSVHRRRERAPGIWGAIMHFVGPVPEGAPVTMATTNDADSPPITEPIAANHKPSVSSAAQASTWTAEDEAKAKATRAAAARAATARAEAAAANVSAS